jgi:hypothetical protein
LPADILSWVMMHFLVIVVTDFAKNVVLYFMKGVLCLIECIFAKESSTFYKKILLMRDSMVDD